MATFNWNAATGGGWQDGADWTPGSVPGAGDQAVFATGGNFYTVTDNATIAGITVDADAVTFDGSLNIGGTIGLAGTDGAIVDLATGGNVVDAAGVNFTSGTLLEVNGALRSVGGSADVALVSGTGATWMSGTSLQVNQLYVTQDGTFENLDGGNVVLNDGGTLNLDDSSRFAGALDLAGDGTIYVASATGASTGTYSFDGSAAVAAGHMLSLGTDPGVTAAFGGLIAGDGSVAVTSGDVIFDGGAQTKTYTGGTNVLDATLTLTGAGAAGTGAIFLDNGTLIVQADSTGAAGAETVVGAGGNDVVVDTVAALSGSLLVFGSASGTLSFTGGDNNATVVGGAGVLQATGGFGSDAIFGGSSGQDVLTSGTGPTTLASAFGGVLTATGLAPNTLVAAGGNTTLAGANSGGRNLFFTSGTGTTVVQAGAGASTVVANGALNTIYGATGTQDVFLSGGGVSQFDFVSGLEGGTNDIVGFTGSDSLHLTGYDAGAAAAVVASEVVSGGNTSLTLSDNTHIVLFGYTGVTAATFT